LTEKTTPFLVEQSKPAWRGPNPIRSTCYKVWTGWPLRRQRENLCCHFPWWASIQREWKINFAWYALVTKKIRRRYLPNLNGCRSVIMVIDCVKGVEIQNGENLWKSAGCEIRQWSAYQQANREGEIRMKLLERSRAKKLQYRSAIRFLGRSLGKSFKRRV